MFIFIIYVFSCFGVGVLISIIRPFNPNNVYFIGSLLKKNAFKILGIYFEKRNETIPRETYPVVFMSNHQNNLDLFTGGATIKPRTVLV
jgi:1-acyl-sn-glycerol-3-phosphate acyltransferase